jgi:hypothetical protein
MFYTWFFRKLGLISHLGEYSMHSALNSVTLISSPIPKVKFNNCSLNIQAVKQAIYTAQSLLTWLFNKLAKSMPYF